jgi:phage terminase Nu1 subunit (DNA packaging protein)
MPTTNQADPDKLLDTEDVAELLLVDPRTIRNWLNQKGMPSISDERGRRFEWSKVLPWYVKMKAEQDGNGRKSNLTPVSSPKKSTTVTDDLVVPPETFDAALTRKTIAEADLKELDLATRRREVVAVADAGRMMQDTVASLRTEILAWPTVMIGRVFGVKDRNQLFSVLTASARDLCGRLSRINPAAAPSEVAADE